MRLTAAWALEQVRPDYDASLLLQTALTQWLENDDTEPLLGWEIFGPRPHTGDLTVAVAESCLSNANADVRGKACLALIPHAAEAKSAIPVLKQLVDDPDSSVRRRAGLALLRVEEAK